MSTPRTPCVGKVSTMFNPRNAYAAGKRLCASCPAELRDICLFRALEFEQRQPQRWGVFGGLSPADRERVARALDTTEIGRRLLAAETRVRVAVGTGRFTPAPTECRYRECRGCGELIRQPRAGRPKEWCSPACRQRHTTDRDNAARVARARWASLSDTERERRREAMRARWASLSPNERAELARRRRQRRASRRVAA